MEIDLDNTDIYIYFFEKVRNVTKIPAHFFFQIPTELVSTTTYTLLAQLCSVWFL